MKKIQSIDELFTTIGFYYWSYDNGWNYDNKSWNAYAGPYFQKSDHLVMLISDEIAVLHYKNDYPEKQVEVIFRGTINDFKSLHKLLINVEEYRVAYCLEIGLDPARDIEPNLIEYQNSNEETKFLYNSNKLVFKYYKHPEIPMDYEEFIENLGNNPYIA